MLKSKYIPQSAFLKNVVTLFTGTAIANIIILAVTPVVSRLYSPEYFADLELFTRICALLMVLSTLRYEHALPLVNSQVEVKYLLQFIFRIIFTVTFLVGVVLLIFHFLGYAIQSQFWLLPIAVFALGTMNTFTFYSVALKKYKAYSKGKVLGAFASSSARVGLAYTGMIEVGLIVTYILNILLTPFFLVKSFWKTMGSVSFRSKISKKNKLLALRFSDFPKFGIWHTLVDMNRELLLVIAIQYFLSEIVLGWYALMIRVLKVPIIFIGSSIRQVFYQEFTDRVNKGEKTLGFVLKILRINTLISIIPFTALFFWGGELFSWVFGQEWKGAGEIAEVCAPWIFLNFLTSPYSMLPVTLEKQKQYLFWGILGTVALLGSLFIGIYLELSTLNIFVCISISQVVYLMALLIWYIKLVQSKDRN